MIHIGRMAACCGSLAMLGFAISGAYADVTFLAHYNGPAGVPASLNPDMPTSGANNLYNGSNRATITSAGKFGNGASVLSNQVMEYDTANIVNTTAGTVMLWAKGTDATALQSAGKSVWFSIGTTNTGLANNSTVTDIYLVGSYNTSDPSKSTANVVFADNAGHQYKLTSANLSLTEWHNYAITWNADATGVDLALFVDGVQAAAVTDAAWSGFVFDNNKDKVPANKGPEHYDNKFMVGGVAPSLSPNTYGTIDEVAITNDAKSADSIADLYALQTGGAARELTAADLQSVPEISSVAVLSAGACWLLRRKR